MPRVLEDTAATIRQTIYQDGTATDVGTITIGIVDLLGNLITPSATEAVVDNDDGTYDYVLAAQPNVDFGLITWIDDGGPDQYTGTLEVVGANLFTEAAARAFKNGALADDTKYPDPTILADRDRITDALEKITGRSWVQRYRLMTFRGTGTYNLWLPDFVNSRGGGNGDGAIRDTLTVLTASDQDGSIDPADIVIAESGLLVRTDAVWKTPDQANPVNITLEIEYGAEDRDGADWAAMEILVDRLRHSNIPDRAISWTDEFGNIRLDVMPTQARDWIKGHDFRVPVG